MNNLQPYEKYLADKLEQVPVPDKNEGWVEMRKLLDEQQPEGGTGWSGNRKWWWMGLTVAIIISGVWLSQRFKENELASNKEVAAASSATTEKKESSIKTSPQSEEIKQSDVEVTKESSIKTTNSNNVENKEKGVKTETHIKTNPNTTTVGDRNNSSSQINKSDNNISQRSLRINDRSQNPLDKTKARLNQDNDAIYAGAKHHGDGLNLSDKNRLKENIQTKTGNDVLQETFTGAAYTIKSPGEQAMISGSLTPGNMTDLAYIDQSEILASTPLAHEPMKAQPGKTDKAFSKEMRKKSIGEDNRKMSKKGMRGISGEKDHELTFAAGLSLPQSFAIGSQQSPAYGINAKTSTVSDYVPVPFFQYHVNNKLFLQTELQFQAPQFTDRLLISQTQHPVAPSSGMLERNIYVEKLYYFHIPINLYFSPIRNVYFGTGLQYSSLLSGVATYQDNTYSNGSLQNSNSRVQGFKDDSVAAKLASSEWRYQLEANYYFKRFTLGARYNQALTQFVNLQPSPTLPFTQGRNQTFLISLRYNIWEEKKKTPYTNSW